MNRTFDVIVIGAGINGTGIARDAAMRGLRVLLLDKGDLSSGTTAYSTRLIHGGIRYLEHGEIGLVRESLRERERLLTIAPHLVRPLQLMIPIYRGARRGRAMIRAGMIAYDLLSRGKSLEHHQMLSRAESLERVPGLNPDGLVGAATYFDAQVEYAERLAVENALSARQHGASVLTYSRVHRILDNNGKICGVGFTDVLDDSTGTATATIVINAAGPWVDEVAGKARGAPDKMIGGTKGSHIIVGPFPGAPKIAIYSEARADGRPFFVIPWNDLYLIGTTDIRYSGDLDRVRADASEIDYLLRETNRLLPSAPLNRESVIYTYSGVRPLPSAEGQTESAITRRHLIHDHGHDKLGPLTGLISIIGGKLTTYRNLSEQVVDLIFNKLGRTSPPCLTGETRLPGAEDLKACSRSLTADRFLPQFTVTHLLRVYGSRAAKVIEIAGRDPDLMRVISPETGAIAAEIPMSFEEEMARTLADVLLRRTMIGRGSTAGIGADRAAALVCIKHLGWDEAWADEQVRIYRGLVGGGTVKQNIQNEK